MTDEDRVRYESCKRSAQFGKDWNASIPGGSQLATEFSALATDVDDIEASAGKQTAGKGESGQQFDIKGGTRESLRDALTSPADAARAAEPTNPGTQDSGQNRQR